MGIFKRAKNAVALGSFVVAASFGPQASAGLINFDTCINNCEVLDVEFGGEFTSVASLDFSDNGAGGVDFVLTNTFDDFDASQTRAFLSELFLDFAGLPTSFSNESSNIDSILISADKFSVGQNLFDVKLNFANSGSRRADRILAGDSASWTLGGISEFDVINNGVVIAQRISTDEGFGAARILGVVSADTAQSVPEPASFALLLLGAAGLLRSRRFGKRGGLNTAV